MPRTRIDRHGRVVLPAALRRSLGLREGSELLAEVEGDRIVLIPKDTGWAHLRALFDAIPPTSVVDELIDERRAEARRDP